MFKSLPRLNQGRDLVNTKKKSGSRPCAKMIKVATFIFLINSKNKGRDLDHGLDQGRDLDNAKKLNQGRDLVQIRSGSRP